MDEGGRRSNQFKTEMERVDNVGTETSQTLSVCLNELRCNETNVLWMAL